MNCDIAFHVFVFSVCLNVHGDILLISPFYSLVTNKLLVVATQIANQPSLKFIIKFVLYKESISTRRVPIFVVEKDNNKVMSSIRTTGVKMSTKQHTYQLSRTN